MWHISWMRQWHYSFKTLRLEFFFSTQPSWLWYKKLVLHQWRSLNRQLKICSTGFEAGYFCSKVSFCFVFFCLFFFFLIRTYKDRDAIKRWKTNASSLNLFLLVALARIMQQRWAQKRTVLEAELKENRIQSGMTVWVGSLICTHLHLIYRTDKAAE